MESTLTTIPPTMALVGMTQSERIGRGMRGKGMGRRTLGFIPLPLIPLPIRLLFFFLLAVWTSPVHAEDQAPWARIVIIGASVSHGFTLAEPFDGPKTKEYALDRYLNAALLAPHEPVRNLANAMFFMLPDDMGHTQIRQALTNHPTLVIGIDFPFWFCYGAGRPTRTGWTISSRASNYWRRWNAR